MVWLIIVFCITIIVLLARLFFIKKEIKNITSQLNDYNKLKTRKKIDIKLFDKDIENLAKNINKHICVSTELQIKEKNSQDELKRTIANISHDLRTPLTSILGYIHMLKNSRLEESKKNEYLDIVQKRAKDLQSLLNNFFTLSVVESAEYELDLKYINLNKILCESISGFYNDFIENGIEPTIDLENKDIIVVGDIDATKRVLDNLMINIVKHSKKYVEIKLYTENSKAVLTMINECGALTEKDIKSMLDRFYRADESRNLNNGNTGLGLSIVSGLMKKMNGSIKCEIKNELLYISCVWNRAS